MEYSQSTTISYTIGMSKPSTHYFEVEISFDNINDEVLDLTLPVWRPGRYLIFDFSSGIQEFIPIDYNNKELKFKKLNKHTWRIETGLNSLTAGSIKVKYRVYANEFNLRTRGLDDYHAFVNGTAVFMYSEKYRYHPLTLNVIPYSDWHVSTGLEMTDDDPFMFKAPTYDYFVDCPLEIGNQKDYTFEVEGRKHIISFFGDADYDIEKIKNDFSKIIRKNFEFWGRIPYERYVFIVHCTPYSGGGTEHLNSTVVGVRPDDFEKESTYKNFLRLISHEFFHTWNVKQLKPKGLTPYDYTKENYTEELWIAEGSTSYYDGVILSRTGQYETEDILKEIAGAVEEDRRRPGNKVQSLAESSFDSWVKFWKRTRQSYNAETDYYKKGADVSLILDLEIRHRTENKYSLDDVFNIMLERFPQGVSGYTNEDFMNVCSELGGSFQEFFDNFVYGTVPIDWERFLLYAGLKLESNDSTIKPVIGLSFSVSEDRIIVNSVIAGSCAEDAGFSIDDEIIAVDGVKAEYKTVEKRLSELKPGESVLITVFKQNKLKEIKLTLKDRKIANYYIKKVSEPDRLQKTIFESWLGKPW